MRLAADPEDRSPIRIQGIALAFLNALALCFSLGSLRNPMGFDTNPMGSERFQSDPMVGWDGSTGEANEKSYSYLDQMSYESIFNDQSSDESIFNDRFSDQ
ncbi:unnamed protein product [Rotaria socialis]|uniref:Uncharacterized protein n=1 Tax=Rotaria socialis TaxID=392032 RepID=A0A818NWS7_9BILA|nr:unnamed protein product [Rotaria socialis]CAF4465146.1 unnamed protein product [Rotaria socialis]CAF4748262.1 unnamed protein product [Rotaria socialis]